jgi:hypothetical protein
LTETLTLTALMVPILIMLKVSYPINFLLTLQGGPKPSTCSAPCSAHDVETFLTCANSQSCLGSTSGFDFFECIDTQCQFEGDSISQTCEECLRNPFDSGLTVRSKFRNCAGLRNVDDDVDTSCQFVFGNQTDNLILSKYPIIANDTLYYTISPFSAWSVTYAQINVTSFGKKFIHSLLIT